MGNQEILEEESIAAERAAEAVKLGAEITERPIRDLSGLKSPVCIAPDATVHAAVQLMNDNRIGCLLVTENDLLCGIFTERDVLTRVVLHGVDVATTPVRAVMTADPETLTLDDGIAYALNMMSVGGFRHVPLVDEEGHPTGVIAMRAAVEYIVGLFPTEVLNIAPEPRLATTRSREGA